MQLTNEQKKTLADWAGWKITVDENGDIRILFYDGYWHIDKVLTDLNKLQELEDKMVKELNVCSKEIYYSANNVKINYSYSSADAAPDDIERIYVSGTTEAEARLNAILKYVED